jgi:hypothetical protein
MYYFQIHINYRLLPDRSFGTFSSSSVGLGALPANRQIPPMANAPITTKVEQALYIELSFTA